MNCSDCQKNIVAYLEEKLPYDKLSITATHLENCKECSFLYNKMESVYSLIDAEKSVVCNPYITTRVMAAIENREIEQNKEPVIKRILQTSLIAVSIAIAVFGGIEAGNLYTVMPERNAIPEEMAVMNDAALESLNIYTAE
jgi:predicted anti-sigma-YlaC factor YlaD